MTIAVRCGNHVFMNQLTSVCQWFLVYGTASCWSPQRADSAMMAVSISTARDIISAAAPSGDSTPPLKRCSCTRSANRKRYSGWAMSRSWIHCGLNVGSVEPTLSGPVRSSLRLIIECSESWAMNCQPSRETVLRIA